jgi:glycosyltransferase involved in cell wall biosynthesis
MMAQSLTSNRRVAFVSQCLGRIVPPKAHGSIAIWTYETARRLARDHSVLLIELGEKPFRVERREQERATYCYVSTAPLRLINAIHSRLAKIVRRFWSAERRLRAPDYTSIFHNLGFSLQAAWQARRAKCEVIHVHNFSQFAPVVRCLNRKARVVLHMNCEWLSQHDERMIVRRLKSVDAVICCSGHIRRKLLQRFPHMETRSHIVYNGGDVERFIPCLDSVVVNPPAPLRILFVGRISPEKGVHLLMEAFALVGLRFPTAELHMVGGAGNLSADFLVALSDDPNVRGLEKFYRGDYFAEVKSRIPEHLRSRVIFHGNQSHDQLKDHFKNATIFVISSLSDAFPLTVVEAMAAGLPVVGSAVGGIPEAVVHETTGLLVTPNSPESLAEGLSRLLADSEMRRRMAIAGRERALNCFSYQAIADQLSAVYARVESGGASAKDPFEGRNGVTGFSVDAAKHAANS